MAGLGGGIGGADGAAGRHDKFHIPGQQKPDVLPGILDDGFPPAGAIGNPAGVAEVDNVLAGQHLAQLTHGGQAAQAAVKNANGTVIHQ